VENPSIQKQILTQQRSKHNHSPVPVNISDRKHSEQFLLCLQAQVERSFLMSNAERHKSNVNVECHYVALNTQKDKVINVLWFCTKALRH